MAVKSEDDVTKYKKYESSLDSRIAAILIRESEAKTFLTKVDQDNKKIEENYWKADAKVEKVTERLNIIESHLNTEK